MIASTIFMLLGLAAITTTTPITFHYKNSSKIPSNYEFQIKHSGTDDHKVNDVKCKTIIYVVSDENSAPNLQNERYIKENIKNNDIKAKNDNLNILDYITFPKHIFGGEQTSDHELKDVTERTNKIGNRKLDELRKRNKNALRDRNKFNSDINRYHFVAKVAKDEEFIDNTDPRNDKGDWEDGELDQKYATTTYRYNIQNLSRGNVNEKISQKNQEDNLTATPQAQNAGDLNDFFVNNTKHQENDKTLAKNFTGELDDFFGDDLKKNKKEHTGDLEDFFDNEETGHKMSQRQSSGDLEDFFESKSDSLENRKQPKINTGELDDFFEEARDVRKGISSKTRS